MAPPLGAQRTPRKGERIEGDRGMEETGRAQQIVLTKLGSWRLRETEAAIPEQSMHGTALGSLPKFYSG